MMVSNGEQWCVDAASSGSASFSNHINMRVSHHEFANMIWIMVINML